MEKLQGLPFAVQTVHGELAYDTLIGLREQHTELTPVVLGDDEEVERLLEMAEEDERDFAQILAAANDINVTT